MSDPGATLWLVPKAGGAAASCHGGCVIDVAPGRYRLTVSGTQESVAGTDDIDIDGPSRVVVRQRTVASRTFGMATALSGFGLLFGGGVLFALSKDANADGCVALCWSPGQAAGLIAMATSLVLIPVGITLSSKTSPDVDVDAMPGVTLGGWIRADGAAGVTGTF